MKIKKNTDYVDQYYINFFSYCEKGDRHWWESPDLQGIQFTEEQMQTLLTNGVVIEVKEIDMTEQIIIPDNIMDLFKAEPFPKLEDKQEVVKQEPCKVPKDYDPKLTNSSIPMKELAGMMKVALKKDECPDCLSILMSGIPGLGKSYSAQYLAAKLNKPIKIVTIASLKEKWIGSTEKNIEAAFKEAEEQGAVLVLDEVDALSPSRDGTTHNHEVGMVNALLQTLDNFKGICIFTTNSTDRMDTAILRRCVLHITMDNMTDQQASLMARRVFPKRRLGKLVGNAYAPADFVKVRNQLLFVKDENVNRDYILEQLRLAAELRTGNKIGEEKISIGFR